MKKDEEPQNASININKEQFVAIFQSIQKLNSREILGSTDAVDLWNGTERTLEAQGLECGWLVRNDQPKDAPTSDQPEQPVEAEVIG